MGDSVILAIVSLLATTIGALIWVIKHVFDKIIPILDSLKEAVDENTWQTKENREYLQCRNGKDAAIWQEVSETVKHLQNQS